MNSSFQSSQLNQSMKSKQERIQEVRKQEKEFSKNFVNVHKKSEEIQKQQDSRDQKQKEYQNKLREIEQLQVIKEQALIQIGEAQRQAQIQQNLEAENKLIKQEKLKNFQNLSQTRYKEAQDWKKLNWLESDEGRLANRITQMKETTIIERKREQSILDNFKQNKKDYEQSMLIDYNALIDKNQKNCLKPEDFAKTNFHNPTSVRHQLDDQKENAIDKANSVFIESQPQLEQTARMQREQDRIQKQRGQKALSKEREKKIIRDLENETKFLKNQLLEENIKSMDKPFLKKSSQSKTEQDRLIEKVDNTNYGRWSAKSQKKNHSQEKLIMKEVNPARTKSVKVFTKKPLDSGLYKTDNSTDRADYSNYPLVSPDNQDYEPTSEKKRVTFSVPQNKEVTVQEFKKSKDKLNSYLQQQEYNQQELEYQDQISSNDIENDSLRVDSLRVDSSQKNKFEEQSRPVQDIKSYIEEQEDYLSRLEAERTRLTNSMRQEEKSLLRTLRDTNKLINKDIAEEDSSKSDQDADEIQDSQSQSLQGSENTYQNIYDTDDQSQSNSNPSYLNAQQQFNQGQKLQNRPITISQNEYTSSPQNKQQQQFQGHQYTFQNPLHDIHSPAQPSQESQSSYEYSPESKNQSDFKHDIDTQDIMMRFLKPQNNHLPQTQFQTVTKKISHEKQQNQIKKLTASPGSELSYSLSELEKSNEKYHHRVENQSNKNNILVQDPNIVSSVKEDFSSEKKRESEFNDSQIIQQLYRDPAILYNSNYTESPQYDKSGGKNLTFQSKQVAYTYGEEEESNLGDIFQKRRAELNSKYMNKQKDQVGDKQSKAQKTKEELLEIRKLMMKRKIKQDENIETEVIKQKLIDPVQEQKLVLMQRLAMGTIVKIDKKEMMALNSKNYEQLPEIRKKKIEQDKKDEYKRRQDKVKELDAKTRQKFKNN